MVWTCYKHTSSRITTLGQLNSNHETVSLYKVFPAWIITSNYWQCSGYFAKSTAFLFLVHSCVSDSLVTFIIWDVVKLWLNLGRLSRYQVPKSSIFQIPIWVDVVYALFTFHSSLMCQMEFTLIELGHLQAKAWCEHHGVSHYLPIYGQSTSSFSLVNANFLDIVLVSCGIYSKFFCMCKCWIFCQVPQSSGNFSVPLRNKVDCVPAISKASNISSWQSAVCSLSNHICSDKLWWTGYLKFRYWILFFATIMVWFQHACQHCVCSISILSSFCCGKLHFNSDIQSKTWF